MGKRQIKPTSIDGVPYERLLIIRLSAMGDVAMTVPVVIALTRKYPKLRLTVLSTPFYEPFFSGIAGVQFKAAVVKKEHKGIKGLYRLFTDLKKQKIDAVADLHGVIRSHILSRLFKTIGIKVSTIDKGRKEKKALTRWTSKTLRPLQTTVERYAHVFDNLGFAIEVLPTDLLTQRALTKATIYYLGEKKEQWIGIAPFAAHKGKEYSLGFVEQIISALAKLTMGRAGSVKILLFGGGHKEVEQLEIIAKKDVNVFNLAGRFSFGEELSIISRLDIMLAMDSGNGHLAAMFGVPVVTLWGITHPYLGFAPFNQPRDNQFTADHNNFPFVPTSVYGNKMPAGYERAMDSIAWEDVVVRVEEILSGKLNAM